MQLFQDFKIFGKIAKREIVRLCSRPVYIFCMIFAPIFCLIFFTTLMDSGLPQGLPVGVVDLDQTHLSRTLTRTLDVFQQTKIVAHYDSKGRNLWLLLYSQRFFQKNTRISSTSGLVLYQ